MKTFLEFSKEKEELNKTSIKENGILFKTGVPVTFEYMRNTKSSPNMGEQFGQHIEPHGRYMLHNTHNTKEEDKESYIKAGWEFGEITFKSPLVIALSNDLDKSGLPQNIYGKLGWKQRLVDYYNSKGKELTNKLIKDGYDGIVTTSPYDTREIISLRK